MLRFDVITLFGDMFDAVTRHGVTARAYAHGLWQLKLWNPRDYADNAYRRVDDRPFGGGPGMVMQAPPLVAAIQAARSAEGRAQTPVIMLSPQGTPLTQQRAQTLSTSSGAILLAGRYEGVDQRLIDRYVDEEVSVGDFIVSGGELPALMLIDAAVRLLPGVLNHPESAVQESFTHGLLDWPHYTRPEVFEGEPVPPVLMSGHHARIDQWRREQSLALTACRRPDLIARAREQGLLSKTDEAFLDSFAKTVNPGLE
jgi:tRNA (guanine37-N1)-methyltransferase